MLETQSGRNRAWLKWAHTTSTFIFERSASERVEDAAWDLLRDRASRA